jgi:hypothetical protein
MAVPTPTRIVRYIDFFDKFLYDDPFYSQYYKKFYEPPTQEEIDASILKIVRVKPLTIKVDRDDVEYDDIHYFFGDPYWNLCYGEYLNPFCVPLAKPDDTIFFIERSYRR